MKNTRIARYFTLFDGRNFRKLDRFLESPCSGVFPDTLKLYHVLRDVKDFSISKEDLFYRVFNRNKFEAQLLANHLKYLCEAIDWFFSVEELAKNKVVQEKLLAKALQKKDSNLHESAIYKMQLSLNNVNKFESHDKILAELELYQEKDFRFMLDGRREENNALQKKNDLLDHYFILQKLKALCEMKNRSNIVKAQFDETWKNEVIDCLIKKGNSYIKIPSIKIYYVVYLTLTEPNDENNFHELCNLLIKHKDDFAIHELRNLYDFAQNYCIKKLNSGQSNYARILFGLYKDLIERKILMENGKVLSQWDYKNIVTLALRLKEFDWTLKFINDNKVYLPKSEAENAYRYNLANYYSAIEDYSQAKRLLQKVDFTDPFYILGAKSILLRCYYELFDEETFFSHCESFHKLLLRNKSISEYQRKVHANLILYTRKAFRLQLRRFQSRNSVSKKEIENLTDRVKKIGQINNLNWLLDKINEIAI